MSTQPNSSNNPSPESPAIVPVAQPTPAPQPPAEPPVLQNAPVPQPPAIVAVAQPTPAPQPPAVAPVAQPAQQPPAIAPVAQLVPAQQPPAIAPVPDLLIILHGIRDNARWATDVANILRQPGFLEVNPIKYGYFNALQFINPVFSRQRVIRKVETRLRNLIANHRTKYPTAKISLLAHSFGCYVAANMLQRDPFLQLNHLVFCGSVLSLDFPSDILLRQVTTFVNDCGAKDIWPVIAESVTWGYGSTGTFGAGLTAIDRFHDFGHSGFFSRSFVDSFWKPLFWNGTKVQSSFTPSDGGGWLMKFFNVIPVKWALTAGCLALIWYAIIPLFIWLLSFFGLELNIVRLRHDYRAPSVQTTAYYAIVKGEGLAPPDYDGTIKSDFVRRMFTWKQWMSGAAAPANKTDPTKAIVVVRSNKFDGNYFTFSTSVTINNAWKIRDGCAFLAYEPNNNEGRPIYKQLDYVLPSNPALDVSTLEIEKPDKGYVLLLVLQIESKNGTTRIPAEPAMFGITVVKR